MDIEMRGEHEKNSQFIIRTLFDGGVFFIHVGIDFLVL